MHLQLTIGTNKVIHTSEHVSIISLLPFRIGVPASKLTSVLKLSIFYRGLWYVYTGNSDFPPPA